MDKTGLARRIAYRILLVFPPTYAGILWRSCCIGFVLTLGIPSMTVRTAILMPIAWALVQALGLPLPGRGSALIILSTFEMAVLPGLRPAHRRAVGAVSRGPVRQPGHPDRLARVRAR